VLRINERIFRKCLRDNAFRTAELTLRIDPFEAVLVEHQCCRRSFARGAIRRCANRSKTAVAEIERLASTRKCGSQCG